MLGLERRTDQVTHARADEGLMKGFPWNHFSSSDTNGNDN